MDIWTDSLLYDWCVGKYRIQFRQIFQDESSEDKQLFHFNLSSETGFLPCCIQEEKYLECLFCNGNIQKIEKGKPHLWFLQKSKYVLGICGFIVYLLLFTY